ncbi:glycoside hydrolase family 88 protein [Reichenbachiella agarivorans]|uniref:Glycoside hydrolase family 88 protein n=1 Tax=Reichenbachiella agarivorans TaxID=2979464 RepID=A0ABY6CTP9_9BACT|nr:glycoside hydrolase family 88 protein [Reichenbachiella agarivorans]UXP33890.1 glycoside hydrolase family 88 protein [Reichenbachiella agarivorans]
MKVLRLLLIVAVLANVGTVQAQDVQPEEVKQVMKKVADWQIAHFRDTFSGRKNPHHPLDWTNGAFYVGLTKWAGMADDDRYYNWLKNIGTEYEWELFKRIYHADDHIVGQMYIDLYRKYNDENMIKPTIDQFDFIMYHPAQTKFEWKSPFHQSRWNWCDALFMSPPVWAKIYNITGEQKYLDFMMTEFKASTDFLFDKNESLYYRDERYMSKVDNGTKVFWSRGNGWVFAGLVNVMNELNPESKEYKYFLKIYKAMAERLLQLQTPQGHWAMSLLGQEFYPTPETSGSSFYIYGFAWGINNGILDKSTYGPAVEKGWNAMVGYVTDEGMLGYVQPIGAAPGNASPDKTEVYGAGAFLSAGAEVFKLYGGKVE